MPTGLFAEDVTPLHPTQQFDWKSYVTFSFDIIAADSGRGTLHTRAYNDFIIDDVGYNSIVAFSARAGAYGQNYSTLPLRYEFELAFAINEVSFSGATAEGTAEAYAQSAMINVYYDIDTYIYAMRPFIGLGLGTMHLYYANFDAKFSNQGSEGYTLNGGETEADSEFIAQLSLGALYMISEKTSIGFEYRIVPKTDFSLFSTTSNTDIRFDVPYRGNALSAQLLYRF